MKKILIVFYSRTDTTRQIATLIRQELTAQKFECDMEEITDLKNREGFWGNMGGGVDAFLKKKTRIKPIQYTPGNYDLIIMGCPVWLGNMPPALRTYVHQNKKALLQSAFFCTFASKGAVKTTQNFMEASGQNTRTLAVKNHEDSTTSLARIREFTSLCQQP